MPATDSLRVCRGLPLGIKINASGLQDAYTRKAVSQSLPRIGKSGVGASELSFSTVVCYLARLKAN